MSLTIEIRAILPRRPILDPDLVEKELGRGIQGAAEREVIRLLKRTVRTWKTKVAFTAEFGISAGGLVVQVFPTGPGAERWGWISAGTRRRTITARRAPFLKFRRGFVPKTRPGSLSSKGGRRGTGDWVQKRSVVHPGIKAREYPKQVRKKVRTKYIREMNNAVRRAIRKSGGSAI